MITELHQVQPPGPYLLGGFSGGGITAYEMAQQFRAAGEEVALCVLINTPLPRRRPLAKRDRALIQWRGADRGRAALPAALGRTAGDVGDRQTPQADPGGGPGASVPRRRDRGRLLPRRNRSNAPSHQPPSRFTPHAALRDRENGRKSRCPRIACSRRSKPVPTFEQHAQAGSGGSAPARPQAKRAHRRRSHLGR